MRFGDEVARVETVAELRGGRVEVSIGYRPGEPKRVTVDGAPERSIERLLGRFPVLVFTPDRLRADAGCAGASPLLPRSRAGAAVAGAFGHGGRVRRAAWPSETTCCGGCAPGAAEPDALDPWDALVAEAGGSELAAARDRCCTRLAGAVRGAARAAGRRSRARSAALPAQRAGRRAAGAVLAGRRQRDIDRAATGAGPHLDDIGVFEHDRDLRLYGSQGEQRRALLALILAEADLLTERARRAAAAAAGRCHRRARRRAPAPPAGCRGGVRPDRRHQHRRGRPGRPSCHGASGRGGAGGGVSDLQRIGDDVRRLGRVPAVDPMVTSARSCWHAAVGDQVAAQLAARSPIRRRAGGALRQLRLGQRADPARAPRAAAPVRADGSRARPAAVRGGRRRGSRSRACNPAAAGRRAARTRERAQAAELAGAISDPELRRAVERAIAAGLARDL